MKTPRYTVRIPPLRAGENPLKLIGSAARAMRRHGVAESEITKFTAECQGATFAELFAVVQRWVHIERPKEMA